MLVPCLGSATQESLQPEQCLQDRLVRECDIPEMCCSCCRAADACIASCRSAFVLPPVMLFCLVGALLFRSALCAAFVTLTLAAWLLPPGKVGPLKELSSGH